MVDRSGLRVSFPIEVRTRMLVASMLVPSVVFWSSAILKETVAMAACGWVILGLHPFANQLSFGESRCYGVHANSVGGKLQGCAPR